VQKFTLLLLLLIFSYSASAQEVHTYGPLKKGESLWQIAAKVSPSPMNRHQVILALQTLNPHAFRLSCNVNSLKINQVLRIPSLSQMQVLSPQEAITEFNRQNQAWKARHQQPIICPDIIVPPPPLAPSIPLLSNRANNNNQTPRLVTAQINQNPVYEQIHFQKNYSSSPSLMMISVLIIIGLLGAFFIDWLLHKYIIKKPA
jgi:FimV-like protein